MQNEEKSMLCFFMRNSLFRHRLQDLLKFDGYCIHRAVFRGKLCKLLINKENNEIRRKINFFLHCWLKNDMLCTAYRSGTPASAPPSASATFSRYYHATITRQKKPDLVRLSCCLFVVMPSLSKQSLV